MSCYALYAPGLGWVGSVSAPSSHDAAAGWYARRPARGIAPPSLRVVGPGGAVTVDRFDVETPTIDDLRALARQLAWPPDVTIEPDDRSPVLCRVVRGGEGRGVRSRRNLARALAKGLRDPGVWI